MTDNHKQEPVLVETDVECMGPQDYLVGITITGEDLTAEEQVKLEVFLNGQVEKWLKGDD